jgi:uncharacterized membrane protein
MRAWLLQILGLHVDQAGRLMHWSVSARGGFWLGWLVLAGVALWVATFLLYKKSAGHLSRFRLLALASLRGLLLMLLLLILARPVLRVTVEGSVRRSMQIMVDLSQSMSIPDMRTSEADLKRATIARDILDPALGLDQSLDASRAAPVSQLSRMEVIRASLANPRMNLLQRLRDSFEMQSFTFGDQLHDAPIDDPRAWVNALQASEPLTRIGDSVNEVLARTRGQSSAGIFIITDGQSNAGRSLVAAADQAKIENVPLFIYGVGITQPRDIIVSNLFTRDVAFVGDELAVNVRVRGLGLVGETATVNLTLNDKQVASQQITFDAAGEQMVAMKFTPEEKGNFTLKARIEPRNDEASRENNETAQPLKVVDDKIKVLYIEQTPRWEFKYLMALLSRDRRVDFKAVLLEADPSVTIEPNSPFLKQFPADAEALTKFDLIILGDVDPRTFTQGQLENLQRWVKEGGGGLLSISGKQYNPGGYANSKIAEMLPVEFTDRASAAPSDRPIHLELTAAGRENQAMRLEDTDQNSARDWDELPPIYWDATITRAKPAVEILAVDPDPTKESRAGKMPVIVLGQSGIGQVMYVGTDNTWRWRKNQGDRFYIALWGQIVQRLAMPHLLGGSKKTQISTDQQKYSVGQKVTVLARLYDDALKPIDDPQVFAMYQRKDASPITLPLRLAGAEKGIYRGEFVATTPGSYQCWVERDDKTRRDFTVVASQVELSETAMNETGLRDLAAATGGQFFREEDLYKLPDVLQNKVDTVQRSYELELWSTWFYFLLMLIVLTAEWILRKISMLK